QKQVVDRRGSSQVARLMLAGAAGDPHSHHVGARGRAHGLGGGVVLVLAAGRGIEDAETGGLSGFGRGVHLITFRRQARIVRNLGGTTGFSARICPASTSVSNFVLASGV